MFPWYLILLAVSIALPIAVRIVLHWLVLPINVRNHRRMPIEPDYEQAHASHFTPDIRETLHVLLAELAVEGFGEPAGVYHSIPSQDLRTLQTLVVNRATGDVAVITNVRSEGVRSTVFSVFSEFPDGRGVATEVDRGIGNLPPDPDVDAVNFSWVRDARTLCEIHRRRLHRLGKTQAVRAEPPTGEEIAYVTRRWYREFARYVAAGYVYADAHSGVYGYTWKGAFLSIWKLQQPLKALRMLLRDRRARRLWRELGMDAWTPPVTAIPPRPVSAAAAIPVGAAAEPEVPGQLRYATGLADDQVSYESTGDALAVRVGRPTVARYLLSRWPTLLSIGFWSLLLSFNFYIYWQVQQTIIRAGRPVEPRWIGLPTLVMAAFLLNDVVRLLLAVLQVRGTIVITATHGGLAYRNAPAFDHTGFIHRDDLARLSVVSQKPTFRKTVYTLHAHLASGRRQTLLTTRDGVAIAEARSRLAVALGIEATGAMYVDA